MHEIRSQGPSNASQNGQIDIGAILNEAWAIFKQNVAVLVLVAVINVSISMALALFNNVLQMAISLGMHSLGKTAILITTIAAMLFMQLVMMVVQVYLTMGLMRINLKLARRQPATVGDLFSGAPYLLSGLGANIIIAVVCLTGMLLFVVPGIIAGLGFSFFIFIILDKRCGPIKALSESWRLTDGFKAQIFIWTLTVGMLMVVGFLACGLGVFIAGPVCGIGFALIYDRLVASKIASRSI
jgi:uncharacterized membrane protein